MDTLFFILALLLGSTAVASVVVGGKAEKHYQTMKDSENEK